MREQQWQRQPQQQTFSPRFFKMLLVGALLVLVEREVASILRVMGCSDEKQFQNYHRVLNRAKWSSRALSHRLLILLVHLFVPATAPVILGINKTIERRRGHKIAARGVYRDPVRSSVEVTFHEVRAHLGVETQRQWSYLAILRTTPALLALFSLVTIFAQQLLGKESFPIRQAAWYTKALPTFSDTLALVRQHLRPSAFFSVSSTEADTIQIPQTLFDCFVDTLAFAA